MRRETRFEVSEESTAELDLDEVTKKPPTPGESPKPTSLDQAGEEESYTERLLRAKKKAWDERKDDNS